MATLVEAMSELKLTPETSESLMVEFKVRKPGGTPEKVGLGRLDLD